MAVDEAATPRACRGGVVVWDDALCHYDFGAGHPMAPVRCDLTIRLADDLDVLPPTVAPSPATEDQLASVHTRDYIAAVRRGVADPSRGLGTADDPLFEGMHDAAALIAGASLTAARLVGSGDAIHAANVTGGLHHAMADRAGGFCLYNDVALAIHSLLEQGFERIAYVDVDVHHGDGVESIFWDDPRVLTISLHETGEMLYPGTGFAQDLGGPQARGSAVNVALPPGTGDSGWLRAFHAVVPPLLEAFQPQVLVTQHGCDSHSTDPLAHLELSLDGQRASYLALHDLAHRRCDGRWVALGGGGYAVVGVVPRAWTHLIALVGGTELDPYTPTPSSWRTYVSEKCGGIAPVSMTDGYEPTYRDWSDGWDPDVWLDRQIKATRDAVFPLHGLDP
jgi:acetoin utilization protein AcuC